MIARYVEEMALTMLVCLPLWALVRWLWRRRRGDEIHWSREVLLAVFVLYLAALAEQTVLPQIQLSLGGLMIEPWDFNGCNYIPLYTIRSFLRYGSPAQVAINLLGNVLVFVPLGLFPPLLWRPWCRAWSTITLGMLCSVLIEVVQPIIGRSRDVDDVILNTLGCALGYVLGWLLLRGGKNND